MKNVVRDYYNLNAQYEWERLETLFSAIEFASALRLIEKYFPSRGKICDIGSGPGRYSLELAKRGYSVTLLDLADKNIAIARMKFKELKLQADDFIIGDARNLELFKNEAFDAALLSGPMYHVIDKNDRKQILHELNRILKPSGVALITYLNSWGLLKTGLTDFPGWYKDMDKVRSLLGEKVFEGHQLSGFTEAYWSTPEAARREVQDANFEIVSYAGAQGFAGGLGHLLKKIATEDPQAYKNIVQLGIETSELPQYRDTTEHIHILAKKNPSG